jgi:hypothetical protein
MVDAVQIILGIYKVMKIYWEVRLGELKYKVKSAWSSFTYIFRRPWYKIQLLYRLSKITYYGPWEICNVLMDVMFEIFCEFYEQCDLKNTFRFNLADSNEFSYEIEKSQNERMDEFDKLYHWWTVEFKQREEEIEELLHTWSEHYVTWWESTENEKYIKWCNTTTRYGEYLNNLLEEEERKFEKEKEEMIIKLIKYRNNLWD